MYANELLDEAPMTLLFSAHRQVSKRSSHVSVAKSFSADLRSSCFHKWWIWRTWRARFYIARIWYRSSRQRGLLGPGNRGLLEWRFWQVCVLFCRTTASKWWSWISPPFTYSSCTKWCLVPEQRDRMMLHRESERGVVEALVTYSRDLLLRSRLRTNKFAYEISAFCCRNLNE